jgi:hypothetical protein
MKKKFNVSVSKLPSIVKLTNTINHYNKLEYIFFPKSLFGFIYTKKKKFCIAFSESGEIKGIMQFAHSYKTKKNVKDK